METKKNIKIALFVSEEMDDQLDHLAGLMGITKHDYIRYCISQSILGYKTSIDMIQEKLKELKVEDFVK